MPYSPAVEMSSGGQEAIKMALASTELVPRGETELVRQRYDRIAAIYDVMESWMELRARRWRATAMATSRRAVFSSTQTGPGSRGPQ